MQLMAAQKSTGQSVEVQQLLLNVEKLAQLRSMLEDAKKGYEMVYRSYSTVQNIAAGNFQLHDTFLYRLLQVSPAVREYKRVGHIIALQRQVLLDCRRAGAEVVLSKGWSKAEMGYIENVYAALLSRCSKTMEGLRLVLSPGVLRLGDGDRLAAIDALWKEMGEHARFLRHFNGEAGVLLHLRKGEAADQSRVEKLFFQPLKRRP
jgi:hypothetical protein